MSWVVRTEALARELLVDVGVSLVVRIVAATGVVRVRAAHQQAPVFGLGQHSDVVLTVVLKTITTIVS
jgi:hypothetical protein